MVRTLYAPTSCVNSGRVVTARRGLTPERGDLSLCLLLSYSDNMTNAALEPAEAPSVDAVIGRNVDYLVWRTRETRASLANHLGMTAGALSHKLRGRRPWTATEIELVARRYRVTIDSLFKVLPDLDSNQEPAG
ncbi:helix-turn-helix domain-containing protein [Marisediminicola sp. LYQ134]|uniref:helix-turn-helix domain-containing protein n=1 Tax=Marisediminicola sp. LYQ134 TaxID=3391061 RepID=UPI003983975D